MKAPIFFFEPIMIDHESSFVVIFAFKSPYFGIKCNITRSLSRKQRVPILLADIRPTIFYIVKRLLPLVYNFPFSSQIFHIFTL